MKTFITITIAAAAAVLVIPTTASAAYGEQPGSDKAIANTACGRAGAFGAFEDQGDYDDDFGTSTLRADTEPGADGSQAGLNNSAVCGNR